jgi:prevent-host-death family protein
MERIGVRELRQHASRYLARVARGEVLEVTDRGRPVAHIVPAARNGWDDLVAAGRVTAAGDDTDITAEAPGDYGIDASAALEAMRATER